MSESRPNSLVESERHRQALVAWQKELAGAAAAGELVGADVAQSWQRSRAARVDPALARAPLVSDRDALVARRQLYWLEVAEEQLVPHLDTIVESGHVLTLFAADGFMLASVGAEGTLERLSEIHFVPGASWSEDVVGTNGPGTALALHRAVHIVGAEHFCEAWHPWHCAAVPLFDPRSQRLIGALDISGHQAHASPFALGIARTLARLVERSLALRAHEHQQKLLEQFQALVARYPADSILAVDAEGCVVAAHPLAAANLSLALFQSQPGTSVITVRDGNLLLGHCYVNRRPALFAGAPVHKPAKEPVRYRLADLEGEHPLLEEARRLVRIASGNSLPVLLLGESGVGKEVAAQAVHAEGPRCAEPFIAVNCGAIPKDLVESELFGYVAGAFSGASRGGGRGKLEAAERGTLFLDEVGELPLSTQAVLLRVLSEGQYTPVGGTAAKPTDARVVAATNRDLQAEVAAGRFRADLFYRLNVIAIALPPLRERRADLPGLCERLLQRAEGEAGRSVRLHPEVMAAFGRYDWPGNVRELENLLKRLAAVSPREVVELSDLPPELQKSPRPTTPNRAPSPDAEEDPLKLRLMSVIQRAHTMADAARTLGVNRSTLYRQLERFGLRPSRGVRKA